MAIFLYIFLFFGSMYGAEKPRQSEAYTLATLKEGAAKSRKKIVENSNLTLNEKIERLNQLDNFEARFLKNESNTSSVPDYSSIVPSGKMVADTLSNPSPEEEEEEEEEEEPSNTTQPQLQPFQMQPLNLNQLQQFQAQQLCLQQIQQQQLFQLFQQQQLALLQQNITAPQAVAAAATATSVNNNLTPNSTSDIETKTINPPTPWPTTSSDGKEKLRRSARKRVPVGSYEEMPDISDTEETTQMVNQPIVPQAAAAAVLVHRSATPIANPTELEVTLNGSLVLFKASNTPQPITSHNNDSFLYEKEEENSDSEYKEEENSEYEKRKIDKRKKCQNKSANKKFPKPEKKLNDLFKCPAKGCLHTTSLSGTLRKHRSENHPQSPTKEKHNLLLYAPNPKYVTMEKINEKKYTYSCTKCHAALSSISEVEHHCHNCFNS